MSLLKKKSFTQGVVNCNSHKVNIENLFLESVALNKDLTKQKKALINISLDQNLSSIKSDTNRFKQILTDLISRSLKHSVKNAEINICARNIGNNLEIKLFSQSSGAAKEVDASSKESEIIIKSSSKKADSLELELNPVKKLVEMQKGSMFIDSTLGRSTLVSLYFPNRFNN